MTGHRVDRIARGILGLMSNTARQRSRSVGVVGLAVLAISGALALLLSSAPVAAAQATLPADRDATLFEDATGALASGVGPRLFAGETARAGARRALLRFDVAGALPAGSTIQSVVLILEVDQVPLTPLVARDFSLHRVSADWGEGTSSAGIVGGMGAPATIGDATWLHRFYTTILWATPGGDFVASPSGTQTVGDVGSYVWGSSDAMVADVQSWLDTPASNFGWLLLGEEDLGGEAGARRFLSREATGAVPRLVIEFQGPAAIPTLGEVGRLLLVLAMALAALVLLRRRPQPV